jgi:hypothetical protein
MIYLALRVHQLPHAAQPIVDVICPRPTVVLRQQACGEPCRTIVAVQVAGGLAVGRVLQHLRQASGRTCGEPSRTIQHVVSGDAVHCLGHAVTLAVVGELGCQGAVCDLGETVGVVVGVGAYAVVQQACPEPVEGLPLLSQVYTTPLTLVKRLAASYS